MFGSITVPYESVMLYNVCKLKEGVEWSEDLEFAIGEMCNVVRETYDDFIAGQVLKYAGFISEEGSVGNYGQEGNHFALITYWKSFEAHEESHRADLFLKAFGGVLEFCSEAKLASDLSTILTAIAALSNYDLPIFLAVSCSQIDKSEKLYLGSLESRNYSDKEDIFFHEPFDSLLDKLITRGGYSALLVMHSEIDTTQSAITRISEKYKGPIGAYPNAGYWERPQWIFVDQVLPDDYLQKAKSWVEKGAQIIGGCCGIGPEHIRALTRLKSVMPKINRE